LETAKWKLEDVMNELDGTKKEEKINSAKREGTKRAGPAKVEERDKTKTEKPKDQGKLSQEEAEKQATTCKIGRESKGIQHDDSSLDCKACEWARRRTMKESGKVQVVEVPFPKGRKPRPYGGGVN
jgi:hypothetical protein